MTMNPILPNAHLSDDILPKVILGISVAPEWEEHLENCEECLRRAVQLQSVDTFVELLASSKTILDQPLKVAPTLSLGFDHTPSLGATRTYTGIAYPDSEEVPRELAQHPKYRPIRKLGSGGMGSIWLAEHNVMKRLVAVKAIRPEFLKNPTAKERFLREIRATAQLHHPNIVASFDAEESDGGCLLTMEYVPGEVLSTIVRNSPMPLMEACQAVRDAALGLQRAHDAGLVHRDVKPSNLIRTPDGLVKVLDFGLVVAGDTPDAGLTGVNMVMGTPDYIAPEQAENAKLCDVRSDIYSLGCTLYHLLSGKVPFPTDSILKKLDAHRTDRPQPISDLPESLTLILNRMMAKNPADRFPTALSVAQALEPFAQGITPAVAKPKPRWPWRTQIITGFILAMMLFGVMAVAEYRVKTDKGELVIETMDDEVEVLIKQGGKVVTIYDPKSKQKVLLQSGTYEIELNGQVSGLKLDIDKATLKRGDVVVAKITRQPVVGATSTNSQAGKPTAVIPPTYVIPFKQGDRFGTLDFSEDGRKVVATRSAVDLASVYATDTGRFIREVPNAFIARFTPDGQHLITADYSVIRVVNLETGKVIRSFATTQRIYNLEVAKKGTTLCVYHPDCLDAWDWEKGLRNTKLTSFEPDIDRGFVTPDGKHFLHQKGSTGPVQAIDLSTGKPSNQYAAIKNVKEPILSFTTDAQQLICGAANYSTIFEVATGKKLAAAPHTIPLTTPPTATPASRRFIGCTSNRYTLGIYDTDRGIKVEELQCPDIIEGPHVAGLAPTGETAALGIGSNLYLWRMPLYLPTPRAGINSEKPIRMLPMQTGKQDLISTISSDGRLIALPIDNAVGVVDSMRIISTASGETVRDVGKTGEELTCATFSENGDKLYTFTWSGNNSGYLIREWDLKAPQDRTINTAEPITSWPCNPSLSQDGSKVAFTLARPGDHCEAIRIIDVASGKTLNTIQTPFQDGYTAMTGVFSPDSQSFLTAAMHRPAVNKPYSESHLKLYNLVSNTAPKEWLFASNAFEPFFVDGQPLIGARRFDGISTWYEMWNINTKQSEKIIPAPAKQVTYGIARQGKLFTCADPNGSLHAVALANGKEIWSGSPLPRIERVILSADGRILLAMDRAEYRVYRLPDVRTDVKSTPVQTKTKE
jgi:serine/threonine protein kinase/WD40 repeat protein